MTLSVLITIDTESHANGTPDQHIWGILPSGEEFGIRRIMDILERYSARGTFYVSVYEAERHGREALGQVVREINERGHEVSLHTHPSPRFGNNKMSRVGVARQCEILSWGKAFIEEITRKEVLAHRAGAFAANLDTITALRDVGVKVDASLSPAWFESDIAREVKSPNYPFKLHGLLELPVTYYVQTRIGAYRSIRMVDIEACTLRELKSIVRQALTNKVSAINLLMHSHSLLRGAPGNVDVLTRLEKYLQFLQGQPEIIVSTTRGFFERWQSEELARDAGQPFMPYTGWWLTYLRALEFFGHGWKNTLVAILPLSALAVASLGLFWWK